MMAAAAGISHYEELNLQLNVLTDQVKMSMDVITSPSFSASERRSRWAALCKVLNVVLAYYQFTAYEASRKDGTRGHAVLITRIIDNGMLTVETCAVSLCLRWTLLVCVLQGLLTSVVRRDRGRCTRLECFWH